MLVKAFGEMELLTKDIAKLRFISTFNFQMLKYIHEHTPFRNWEIRLGYLNHWMVYPALLSTIRESLMELFLQHYRYSPS